MLSDIVTILVEGLTNAMLLFLAAAGLTIIFGVLGVLNFAHGSFYMFGAYFAFFVLQGPIGNFWIAVLVAAVLVGILGGIIEYVLIRPIYEHDHVFQVLLTFALVLILDNGAQILWGTEFRIVGVPSILSWNFTFAGTTIPAYNLFVIFAGTLVAVLIWISFTFTRSGKIVKMAAENREIAGTLNINVTYVFTTVFILGSALAGLGGALATPYYTITPSMGLDIIISAFIIVILGGLGSFRGAYLASLLIGLGTATAFVYAPVLEPVVSFLLLIVVLLLFPGGLFGEEVAL